MLMQNRLALALSLAGVFASLTLATSFDWDATSGNNGEQRQQQGQHRFPHRDMRQLSEQLRLKTQHETGGDGDGEQQQQRPTQQQFDPFDFANSRRMPQINNYYGADYVGANNNNKPMWDRNGALAGGSVQAWYGQHEDDDGDEDDDDDDDYIAPNNGNIYGAYKYETVDDATGDGGGHNMPHATAASPLHDDAAVDFRLQLSDFNEPVGISRITQEHAISHNNNNNNNNYNYNNNNRNNNNSHSNNGTNIGGIATKTKSASSDHASYKNIASNNNNDNNNGNKRFLHRPNMADAFDEDAGAFFDTQPDVVGQHLEEELVAGEDDELAMTLPYGIQNVRKRTVRGNPSKSTTYQSLCPTKRTSIPLETSGFEYRPNHYIEVTCAHAYTSMQNNFDYNKNRVSVGAICSEAGFSCIQLNRTIHLIRRNKAATVECWESEIRIVPSGCECMWPKHSYGDIVAYHEAQKRAGNKNGQSDGQASPDYQAGLGFRQVELVGIDGRQNAPYTGAGGFEPYVLY